MNKITQIVGLSTLAVAFLGSSIAVGRFWQSSDSTAISVGTDISLTAQATNDRASRRPFTSQEIATLLRMRDKLRNLRVLGKANPRSASLKLIPLLRNPIADVRADAARELGRLEQPLAEVPLSQLLAELENARQSAKRGTLTSVQVPPEIPLRMALARIRTRRLKGQARLQAVTRSVGLTWNGFITLTKRVDGPERSWLENTDDATTVDEMIDLLYSMIKRGENVGAAISRISLTPQQQVMLEGARLQSKQEALFLVSYIAKRHGAIDGDMYKLQEHLLSLGDAATVALIGYLRQVKAHPDKYRRTSALNFGFLLDTAAKTGDARVLPLLKHFEKFPKPWPQIREDAKQARQWVERQQHLLKST